uniref:Uncharacterized protein LOC105853063 n=1 Tax=Cicer arietinum TaxID=3827 RepID=A0A1S3EJG6_CICAR|nr:uncharacterized protein LOC105853063 [Cicer arietinum]
MEIVRNSSMAMAFLLAFFIISSDIHMESHARGVSEERYGFCGTNDDCQRNYHCPPGLVAVCVANECTCVHSQQTKQVSDDINGFCSTDGDCQHTRPCPPGLIAICVGNRCTCIH